MTENDRATLHTSLLLELTALERAVALLDRVPGDLFELIDNVLYIGLPRRIAHLKPKAKERTSG